MGERLRFPFLYDPHDLQLDVELLYATADHTVQGSVILDDWSEVEQSPGTTIFRCQPHLGKVNTVVTIDLRLNRRPDHIESVFTLRQRNAVSLLVGLTLTYTHPEASQIWSFDALEQKERCIYGAESRQAFPACGLRLGENGYVGFLMDTGVANEWSRWHLRRTDGGNAPVLSGYDPILMEAVPEGPAVRIRAGQHYPTYAIEPESAGDSSLTVLRRKGCACLLAYDACAPGVITAEGPDGAVQSFPIGDQGRQVLTLPPQAHSGLITLTWPEGAVKVVSLHERQLTLRPWHRLCQDAPRSYRYFHYYHAHRPHFRAQRLWAQKHLANALGFRGSLPEEVLYADYRALNWLAEPGLTQPLCVPSIDYFEMYFRDIFWSTNGVDDAALNAALLETLGRSMDERGWVDNILTPFFGSIEKTDNELNYLYVIWSWQNQKRFGLAADRTRVEQVVRLVIDRYDPGRTGVILTSNPQSLMDVMWQDRPCRFAVSQGYFALTLHIALAMGLPCVDAAYAQRAAEGYRSYYAPGQDGRSFLHTFPGNGLGPDGRDLDIISCLDLEPEFLSLYCLGQSLLGGEIVRGTLDCMPVFSGCLMPIMACTDGRFFTREHNPFSGGHYWEPGRYANGGSYLRPQYIVLAAGKYHGWEPADRLMHDRLHAEINTCPDAPVSMEYLHALGDPALSSSHKVFAWNVFVCQINRWIRETIDPDFQP